MPINDDESRLKNAGGRRPASGDVVEALPMPVVESPADVVYEELPNVAPPPPGGMASRLRELRGGNAGRSSYEPAALPQLLEPMNLPKPSLWYKIARFFGQR